MGQIKNIKLHIVTDIKVKRISRNTVIHTSTNTNAAWAFSTTQSGPKVSGYRWATHGKTSNQHPPEQKPTSATCAQSLHGLSSSWSHGICSNSTSVFPCATPLALKQRSETINKNKNQKQNGRTQISARRKRPG